MVTAWFCVHVNVEFVRVSGIPLLPSTASAHTLITYENSHYLHLSESIVTFLLSWCRCSADTQKMINTLCNCSESQKRQMKITGTTGDPDSFLPVHETPADTTQCTLLDVVQFLR